MVRLEWAERQFQSESNSIRCGALVRPEVPDVDWNAIPKVRWATVVKRPNDTTLISYYDSYGDNVRTVDVETDHAVTMGYDGQHNLVAKADSVSGSNAGPLMCWRYDERGLVVQETRVSLETSEHSTTCASYDAKRPYLTALTVPTDGTVFDEEPVLALQIKYDNNGNPHQRTDARGDVTTYDYDTSTNRLRSIELPNGTTTKFENYHTQTGLPRRVIEDASGAARKTEYVYDAYGHVKTIDRHGWGPNEQWNWSDRVRVGSHTVTHDYGAWTETFGHYGNGRLKSSETPLSRTTWTYSPEGLFESQKTESLSEDATTTRTCAAHDVQGQLLSSVSSLGLQTKIERDYGPGLVIERAELSHFNQDSDICAKPSTETRLIDGDLGGEVRRDALGRVIQRTSSDDVTQKYRYDHLGRLEQQIDASGARVIYRYDARSRLQARVVALQSVTLPERISHDALSVVDLPPVQSVTFLSYDDANQVNRQRVYVRPAAGETLTLTEDTRLERDIEQRTLTHKRSIDDEVLETVTTFDGIGRVLSQTDNADNFTSVDYVTPLEATFDVRGPDGSTISKTVVRSQLGAPVEVRDGGGRRVSGWDYDSYGRSIWREDESGAGVITAYNGLSQPTRSRSVRQQGSNRSAGSNDLRLQRTQSPPGCAIAGDGE